MIFRRLIVLVTLSWVLILGVPVYAERIADVATAERYCNENAISGVEGIWEFPDDETSIFIIKDPDKKGRFKLILLESPDCRFEPGDAVGYLDSSADKEKFSLNLRIEKSKDIMSTTKSCVAVMSKDGTALMIKPMKFKISFRTMWFLPKFWRSLKISVDNPKADLPVGLVKVYPGGTRDLPIYF